MPYQKEMLLKLINKSQKVLTSKCKHNSMLIMANSPALNKSFLIVTSVIYHQTFTSLILSRNFPYSIPFGKALVFHNPKINSS